MFLRPLLPPQCRSLKPPLLLLLRHSSSSSSSNNTTTPPNKPPRPRFQTPPPPFQTIPTCPSPTCVCAPTPPMPEGLPIDHAKALNGTMAAYAQQLVICTGKDDWPSRIEEDEGGDCLAADVKELVGRGGVFSDPYHNILITASSLHATSHPRAEIQNSSAYLFPSFKYIPFLPRISFSAVEALVKGYLLPETLHKAHEGLSPVHRDRLTREERRKGELYGVRDVKEVVVLVCGHGGRDMRCGVIAPILRREFEVQFDRQNIKILNGSVEILDGEAAHEKEMLEGGGGGGRAARVAAISHVGGHKYAGNVIVYVPPGWVGEDGKESPLAGKGIWYGRVEPKHVEGIVRETVGGGRVIADLFRGGVGRNGEVLRM